MLETSIPIYTTGQFDTSDINDPFRALTVAIFNVQGANEPYYFTYLANFCTAESIDIIKIKSLTFYDAIRPVPILDSGTIQ